MRSIRLSLSAALVASAVLSTSAIAEQVLVPGNPPPPNPDEEWHFAISPRVWFRTNNIVSGAAVNCGNFGSFSAFCSNSEAALSFIMGGASFAIEPPMLQTGPHPTDIVITSYGGASQQLSSHQVVYSDQFLAEESNAVGRGSRIDSEILGRTSLDPTGDVRVVYGLRWLRNTTTTTFNFVSPFVPPSVVPHTPITTETDSLLGEGGVQFAVPIGPTPHSVFGGMILGFGNSSDLHSAAELFMDASLGYSYALTDNLAPYIRYRFQVFAPFKGGPFLDNVQVVHGPELGFTLRFPSPAPSLAALAPPVPIPASAPPPPPPGPADVWHFAISPRVWLRTNNIVSGPAVNCGNFSSRGVPYSAFCSNSDAALSFVMVGSSFAIEPPMLQGGPHPTDIVITSYGGPSQQLNSRQVVYSDRFLGDEINRVGRGSRIDSEILGRTSLDPTGDVRVVYGLRWLRNTTTTTFNYVSPFFPPSVVPHTPVTTETDSLLGEGGVQFAVPIGPTPHSVFGGMILGFGNSSDLHSAAEAFMDASLGYSYALTDTVAPYLRYRFQVFAPFRGGPFLDNVQVVHGPEVGFTVRF